MTLVEKEILVEALHQSNNADYPMAALELLEAAIRKVLGMEEE